MRNNLRYMFFIDGSNFLIELGRELNLEIKAEKPPFSSFNFAKSIIDDIVHYLNSENIIRIYWFGSYQGDEEFGKKLRFKLRECGFEPIILKKRKGKEKGVDISLTKEMLVNAFNKNFDVAFLIAGDEDYLSLVHEVKRYGARIKGAFFNHGLSDELKIAFDSFRQIDKHILIEDKWDKISQDIQKEINSQNIRK